MASKILSFIFSILLLAFQLRFSTCQTTLVKGGYWFPGSGFAVSDINSAYFTHLFCAFADVNSQTYQVTISSSNQPQFSTFTQTVQRKNPSVKTLLSIGGGAANVNTFASMASQSSSRKSFIDSSIRLARTYNFHGLDLDWEYPSDNTQMRNFGTLLNEWRAAVVIEGRNSGKQPLLLSAAVLYLSYYYSTSVSYPIQAISNSLDWINLMAYDFYGPGWSPSSTGPPAALYNPGRRESGDNGVNSWIQAGLSAKKLVLGFPFYGWSWRLVNANDHGLYAPANGAGLAGDGSIGYSQIKQYISQNNAAKVYNSTVVTDYCYSGTTWIGYDDLQSISTKVSYAKGKGLLGYFAWHVGADDNWALSTKASQTWGA
ncbi:class V chitinase [Ricinus communis]|uniref:Chitinase, putative n=1 Tax=Ricinus communis TaxID=3988 RepID=B9SBZ8_RICCO|nr:class V chitinase [Ricinus communis]EEF38856.1 chitinase, putative [Ricinus communis]|eukprot:XP_002523517.1 class V chitinase [Ricinus communis]